MSAHYSKFYLNVYCTTPYFHAHIPTDYPLHLVLQKSRAFRRLPPRLRELSELSKQWAVRVLGWPDNVNTADGWYDDEGYEMNPSTGKRLTDKEIDAEWERWDIPEIEVVDIPLPDGGFADPDTWEEPPAPPEEDAEYEGPTWGQLLRDIASHGRQYTAKYYGVPADRLARAESDEDLARTILDMCNAPPSAREPPQTLTSPLHWRSSP